MNETTAQHLMTSRRFLPLFITQFLGALNDNFFRTAVVILLTYRGAADLGMEAQTLVTVASGLFILPYVLFCATAGKLADKFDKAAIARIIKIAEVIFMAVASLGFAFHLPILLFAVLFCMGVHSAFFSPVKYALLPDQLHENELMEGNAYVEAGTFIAILLGTIMGGVLVLRPHGETIVSALLLLLAFIGAVASRYIPPANVRDASVRVRFNIAAETRDSLGYVAARPSLLKCSMANSWFWFIGIPFLTLFPVFTQQVIGADEDVVTLFLTCFSVGVGIGSVACNLLLKGKVTTQYVKWSALGVSVFIFDLYAASLSAPSLQHTGSLISPAQLLSSFTGWRMVVDLFMLAVSGGFFVVPLYAVLQRNSDPKSCAQVMASNNIMNAFFMVAASMLVLVLFALKLNVTQVFFVIGLLNLALTIWLFTPSGRLPAD